MDGPSGRDAAFLGHGWPERQGRRVPGPWMARAAGMPRSVAMDGGPGRDAGEWSHGWPERQGCRVPMAWMTRLRSVNPHRASRVASGVVRVSASAAARASLGGSNRDRAFSRGGLNGRRVLLSVPSLRGRTKEYGEERAGRQGHRWNMRRPARSGPFMPAPRKSTVSVRAHRPARKAAPVGPHPRRQTCVGGGGGRHASHARCHAGRPVWVDRRRRRTGERRQE